MAHPTRLELFERKFIPEPMSGCWLWIAGKHRQGYGWFGVHLAHRAAWFLYRGPIPEGMKVLHTCDNPGCVNPEHLFIGTQADNMADCGRKGRSNKKGSINGNAKLTENDVRYIRSVPRSKYVRMELAKKFGVVSGTIGNLRSGNKRYWEGVV